MAAPLPPSQTASRLLVTISGVFLIALWPLTLWRWQAIPVLTLVILSVLWELPLGKVPRRCALLWLFGAVMALGLIGQRDWPLRAGNLLLKSTLSLWAVSLLTHRTTPAELVAGLRWLRLPRLWTEAFAFWSRYYAVLAEEWHRLQLARRSRTMAADRRREFRTLANSLGLLFIRAYERAEQVHRAMLARGYRENR